MEAWLEEMSAIYDKDVLIQLYHQATDKPFGFLYIKVNAKKREDMFYDSLQSKLIPQEQPTEFENVMYRKNGFSHISFEWTTREREQRVHATDPTCYYLRHYQ